MSHVKYEWAPWRAPLNLAVLSVAAKHVTCGWVTSHMNESCHVWRSHVQYESATWRAPLNLLSIYLLLCLQGHDAFIRDMTYSYKKWLIHTWDHSFICDIPHSYGTWPIHTWHDAFICDKTHSWLLHIWVMSHMKYSIFESCHIWSSPVTHDWSLAI